MMPLIVDNYLPSAECYRIRSLYGDGLRDGRIKPHGSERTDVGLSNVIGEEATKELCLRVAAELGAYFTLPPLRLEYCAYTTVHTGGSHPLHADAVKLDGTPNHTPTRIATAMIYLSTSGEDFEGGTFRFPILGIEIPPKVGLLIGFLTGLEYQHEVLPVASGIRDAIAIWFKL